MRSLLTVLSDESLLNRIKLILSDKSVRYSFCSSADEASTIAYNEEIAVAILDFDSPVFSGEELCELLLSINPEMQFIVLFDEKDTKAVLDAYNTLHINMLMCKQHLVLEDLPSLVDSCLHKYNRDEEVDKLDEDFKQMNEMYLRPMSEMSSILNERLTGYEYIIKVFKYSLGFVLDTSEKSLNVIDEFVDRIINDYIQIFMIKEPQISVYFDRLRDSFNDPEGRKYFKFDCENVEIPDEQKHNLLFVLDVITIFFDVFHPFYRGKIAVANVEHEDLKKTENTQDIMIPETEIEVNALYEVRRNQDTLEIYDQIIYAVRLMLKAHGYHVRYGQKNSILQFKTRIKANNG